MADLNALGLAYRKWALERPALYAIIFGGRLERPVEPGQQAGDRALAPLLHRVTRAIDAGALTPGDPQQISLSIWAAVHGAVSLESQGLTDESIFAVVQECVQRGWATEARR